MWEKFKEKGYGLATLGVICSNMALFIIIIWKGAYQIWEPNRWILGIEAGLCLCLLIWGLERYIKDWLDNKRTIER